MPDMVQQHSHGRATCIEVILNLQCAECGDYEDAEEVFQVLVLSTIPTHPPIRRRAGCPQTTPAARRSSAMGRKGRKVRAGRSPSRTPSPARKPRKVQQVAAGGDDPAELDGSRLPLIKGLSNLGNTCFFNSVMQCLNQTRILRGHYMGAARTGPPPLDECLAEGSLTDSLRGFFQHANAHRMPPPVLAAESNADAPAESRADVGDEGEAGASGKGGKGGKEGKEGKEEGGGEEEGWKDWLKYEDKKNAAPVKTKGSTKGKGGKETEKWQGKGKGKGKAAGKKAKGKGKRGGWGNAKSFTNPSPLFNGVVSQAPRFKGYVLAVCGRERGG